jgi:hypothetical protein
LSIDAAADRVAWQAEKDEQLMFDTSRRRAALLVALVTMALLSGCATGNGPLWGADAPRNGAGEVVDPATGLAVPGYWQEAP